MNEIKMFILNNQIDIMLISETHFTKKYYFKIPSYLIYHTHPERMVVPPLLLKTEYGMS